MKQLSYENAIQVDGLCKSFDGFQLKDVTFTLPRGTIMGLIGENGAGKSTTIKLLLSLLQKDSGSVNIFDRPVDRDDIELRSSIGSVLDTGFFSGEMTPREMCSIMAHCHPHWDKDSFNALLTRFQLDPSKKFKDMSRGMKVKLKLAVALAPHPQLLLLDEPTSGLDPVARGQFLDFLRDYIQDENCSILLSSHITSDLERVADYITYLHEGRVLFSKETSELLESYGIWHCTDAEWNTVSSDQYINIRKTSFSCDVLIPDRREFLKNHPDAIVDPASLEDIMTLYAYRPL